jgi:hypothetical protein
MKFERNILKDPTIQELPVRYGGTAKKTRHFRCSPLAKAIFFPQDLGELNRGKLVF